MPVNFNLPLDFSRLENDRLKLVPLEDNLEEWLEIYVQDGRENPQVYDYLTSGPYSSTSEAIAELKSGAPDDTTILLAIILKAGTVTRSDPVTGQTTTFDVPDGTFAGFSGLEGKPAKATCGMGLLLCTKFHRTFVSTQVNGLTLRYLLNPPSEGGLGLRRVEWLCNASNKASIRTAQRMGFQMEGVTRWAAVLPSNKKGSEGAELEREKEGLPVVGWDGRVWAAGRHTANLSLCWDDWVGGGRGHVDVMMRR